MRQIFNPSVMLLNADIHGGTTGGGTLDHGVSDGTIGYVTGADGNPVVVFYDADDDLWYDAEGNSYPSARLTP